MSKVQPSTTTNNMILNGRDTRTGDNIIMPIDISTLATTRSITRKGMNTMKPIWNAVFSSLVMKVGNNTVSGTSAALAYCDLPDNFVNSCRSVSRVCASMNFLSGPTVRSIATSPASCPSMYGLMPLAYDCSKVVLMTKNIKNRARPVSTWFEGVVGMPSACRRIDSTMMMRVKAVIARRMAGSSVSTVIRISTWNVNEYD